MADVFGGAKDNDGVSSMKFLLVRVVNYGMCEKSKKCGKRGKSDNGPEEPQTALALRSSNHPCSKNSEISCDEIAPSRMIFQRASSSVRSTIVEGISRGEVPPSTMMGIRIPSWSRTASAVVHSDSPLRLAEVAVIGIPAAFTTSSGILAFGTRKATLPVLAVTLS